MDINKIYDTIEARITELTGSRPNPTERLEIDLGLDSLDLLDITLTLEKEYSISIPDESYSRLSADITLLDWVINLHNMLNGK